MAFMRWRRAIEISALDRPWLGRLLLRRPRAAKRFDAAYWDNEYQTGVLDRLRRSDQRHHHRLLAALVGEAGPGRRFLEVGAGEGVFYKSLRPYAPARYVGIDISPEAIALGQAAYADEIAQGLVVLEAAEAETWTTAERFDTVLFPECIEYIGDVAGVLRAYAALLAPGGTIGLSMWLNPEQVRRWWQVLEAAEVIDAAVVNSPWGGAWIVAHLRPKDA